MTAVAARPDDQAATRTGRRPVGRLLFLAVLLVVLAVYTRMALEMEWRTEAGRIGPGFFPRIIGGLAIVLTLVELVKCLRTDAAARADEEPGLGRHPVPMLVVIAASVALVAAFSVLGAIIACALFLAATLFFLNRGRPLLNVAVSVGLSIGLYLLFESLLGAGLPSGVLPSF